MQLNSIDLLHDISKFQYVNNSLFSILDQSDIDIILSGLKLIEDSTRINGKDCIKFVPHTFEDTFIKIISDAGCYSYV
jgi:hypothetical protein